MRSHERVAGRALPHVTKREAERLIALRRKVLREPCPYPRRAAVAQILDRLVAALVMHHAAQVIEHLQPDPHRAPEGGDRLQSLTARAGGERPEEGRQSEETSRLEPGDRVHDPGYLRLRELVDSHPQVERLSLVAPHEARCDPLVRDEPHRIGQRQARELRLRPEVEPVARVQSDRQAVPPVEGGATPPRRRSVLDVVDDERARVQRLDDERQPAAESHRLPRRPGDSRTTRAAHGTPCSDARENRAAGRAGHGPRAMPTPRRRAPRPHRRRPEATARVAAREGPRRHTAPLSMSS